MKINVVNGFSDQPNGGNPAGVVYLENDASLSDHVMQEVATKLHFSETAFIKRLGEKQFSIRYFTPAAEVPLCGHATIASFSYLHQKGVIDDGIYELVTIEAHLTVEVTEGIVWMEMDAPMLEQELDSEMVERTCSAYEIEPSDLAEGLEVRIVKSGLRDIHVCVKDKTVLLGAVQHEEEVSAISKELDVVGVHMSCLNENLMLKNSPTIAKSEITAYCSNYAPYYDIPEECATGTSNGGLTYYLYKKGLVLPGATNCFLQGEHMNRPSKVYTKVRMDKETPTIWVGGCGVICEENIEV